MVVDIILDLKAGEFHWESWGILITLVVDIFPNLRPDRYHLKQFFIEIDTSSKPKPDWFYREFSSYYSQVMKYCFIAIM